jgi:hypothetical protein
MEAPLESFLRNRSGGGLGRGQSTGLHGKKMICLNSSKQTQHRFSSFSSSLWRLASCKTHRIDWLAMKGKITNPCSLNAYKNTQQTTTAHPTHPHATLQTLGRCSTGAPSASKQQQKHNQQYATTNNYQGLRGIRGRGWGGWGGVGWGWGGVGWGGHPKIF